VLFEIRIPIIFKFRFAELVGRDMMQAKTCGRLPLRPNACLAKAAIRERGLAPTCAVQTDTLQETP
jgi:hypothetical protein